MTKETVLRIMLLVILSEAKDPLIAGDDSQGINGINEGKTNG
jgi:hypothetical protein